MLITEKLSDKDLELNNLLAVWTALPASPESGKLFTESVPCAGHAPIAKEEEHAA